MDRIIEVKADGNYLTKDSKNAGVRGEYNVTTLRITFDEEWDDYTTKTITFWDAHGANPVGIILTEDLLENKEESERVYLVPIPAEPMAEAGMLTFVIDGCIGSKRQRSMSDKLEVKYAPKANDAAEPEDPTPTQAEQLQAQINDLVSATEAIKTNLWLNNGELGTETARPCINVVRGGSISDDTLTISTLTNRDVENLNNLEDNLRKKVEIIKVNGVEVETEIIRPTIREGNHFFAGDRVTAVNLKVLTLDDVEANMNGITNAEIDAVIDAHNVVYTGWAEDFEPEAIEVELGTKFAGIEFVDDIYLQDADGNIEWFSMAESGIEVVSVDYEPNAVGTYYAKLKMPPTIIVADDAQLRIEIVVTDSAQ